MKVIRVILWLLIIVECIIQIILSYWWYKYEGITYYLLIKDGILSDIGNILLMCIVIILLYILVRWITKPLCNR